MTGPMGNGEFCFSETLSGPRVEAEGNIEGRGETTYSYFLAVPIFNCLVILPRSKIDKKLRKYRLPASG